MSGVSGICQRCEESIDSDEVLDEEDDAAEDGQVIAWCPICEDYRRILVECSDDGDDE